MFLLYAVDSVLCLFSDGDTLFNQVLNLTILNAQLLLHFLRLLEQSLDLLSLLLDGDQEVLFLQAMGLVDVGYLVRVLFRHFSRVLLELYDFVVEFSDLTLTELG